MLMNLDIVDCIGKYFLIEKIAFLSISNICFHEAQFSWIGTFCQFPGNSFHQSNINHEARCSSYAYHISVNTVWATMVLHT